MKKLIYLALTILIVSCSSDVSQLNAQKLSKNEAMNVLTKWEGSWKGNAVLKKSIWIAEKVELEGTTETSLILSNKYLEIFDKNGINESKNIVRYDQISQLFNRWEFKSDGSTSFWTGKWNKSKKRMTWNFIDFSNSGISGQIIEQFKSDEKIEIKVLVKDDEGNLLLEIEAISERTD